MEKLTVFQPLPWWVVQVEEGAKTLRSCMGHTAKSSRIGELDVDGFQFALLVLDLVLLLG